jgi:hypothetical protein
MNKLKILLIISFSLICLQCMPRYYLNSNRSFLYVEFVPNVCIPEGQDIPLCFKISNRTDQDIYINSWFLTFYLDVCDTSFIPIRQLVKIEKSAPSFPKYVLINKYSSKIICPDKIEYRQFDFKKGQSYIIQGKYNNTDPGPDSVNAFIGEIGPYMQRIDICD